MEMTNDNLTLDTWQQYNCIRSYNTPDVHNWVPISWKARRNSSIHVYDRVIRSMVLIRRYSINFDLGRAGNDPPTELQCGLSWHICTFQRVRHPCTCSTPTRRVLKHPEANAVASTLQSLETRHRNYHRLPVKADKPLSLSSRTNMKRRCDG